MPKTITKFAVPALVALLALAPMTATAQPTSAGFVNVPYLLEQSPQAQAATADLQEEFKPRQEALRQQQAEFQQLGQKFQKDALVMPDSERKALEKQLQELKRTIQRDQKAFRADLNRKRATALQGVREAVMAAIEAVATAEGFDLVVGQGALYASDGVNLTQRVLERMKQNFEPESE